MKNSVLGYVGLATLVFGCSGQSADGEEEATSPLPADHAQSQDSQGESVGVSQQALTGNRPVLVLLYEPDTTPAWQLSHGRNPAWWRSRVFGDVSTLRNVNSYLSANARGQFGIREATDSTYPAPAQTGVRIITDPQFRGNTVSLDFPNIAAGASATLTATLAGAQVGDVVLFRIGQTVPVTQTAGDVTAANQISVKVKNTGTSAVNPPPLLVGSYSTSVDTRAGITRPMYFDGTAIQRRRELQLARDGGFDFRPFDRNGDGVVNKEELAVLDLDTLTDGLGQDDSAGCFSPGAGQPQLCLNVALAGSRSRLMNIAHELSHQLVGTLDIYNGSCMSSGLSLMSCTAAFAGDPALEDSTTFFLDPYHRQAAQWNKTASTNAEANCPAGTTCTAKLALVSSPAIGPAGSVEFHRFNSSTNTLFFEYRGKALNYIYDDQVPQDGVVIWMAQMNASGVPTTVPALGGGTDRALFALAPINCIADPTNAQSRGRTELASAQGGQVVAQFGQSYRVKWLNGVDSGYLFTIGPKAADNTVTLSYTKNNTVATCAQTNPDYVVTNEAKPVFPYSTYRGGTLNFTDTTTNSSAKNQTTATTTSYYLSTDTTFSPDDVLVASRTVPALNAGASNTGSATGIIPNTAALGDNHVITCADATKLVSEPNETNNCRASTETWYLFF